MAQEHSDPLPGGGRSPGAIPSHQAPQVHPPSSCSSSRSAAQPMWSLLKGKALACAKARGPLFSLRLSRGKDRGLVSGHSDGSSSVGPARYRAVPLCHARIRVSLCVFRRAGLQVCAGPSGPLPSFREVWPRNPAYPGPGRLGWLGCTRARRRSAGDRPKAERNRRRPSSRRRPSLLAVPPPLLRLFFPAALTLPF